MHESDALPDVPPLISSRPRWRWFVHLTLLTLYTVLLGAVAAIRHPADAAPMLPTSIGPLLVALSAELILFGIIFALALSFSRAGRDELFLRWHGGIEPVKRGFIYSIIFRVLLFAIMTGIAIVASALTGGHEDLASRLRPDTEQLVDARALVEHPFYFFVNITFVSFVFAGFREELWRAGMLAGFNALLPGGLDRKAGRWFAIIFTAVAFGFGHLPQGWGGVLLTAALGLGLGMIIVRQQSIWDAVFAHGFFDATTFALLYFVARFQPQIIPSGH